MKQQLRPQATVTITQHELSSLLIFLDHCQSMLPSGESNRAQDFITSLGKKLDGTHRGALVNAMERTLHERKSVSNSPEILGQDAPD